MTHWLHSIQINQLAERRYRSFILLAFLCALAVPASLLAQEKTKTTKPTKTEVFASPSSLEVKRQLQSWVAEQKDTNPVELRTIANLLIKLDTAQSPEEKLALSIQVFSELSPEVKQVVQAYQLSAKLPQLSSHPLLVNGKVETFYLSNIRYYAARNLTQFRMVDHALKLFNSITPETLIDPAGYLFYKAVCEHNLLQKEACAKTLEQLLNKTEEAPERYTQVAILMQADLAELKNESLDEISRKMSDVERRLELGNSGKNVQRVEDEIIASLDKLIQKMEDQSKSSSSSGVGSGSSGAPGGGSNESRVKGQTAPGEVDKKKLSNNGGWGDLPPKKQASAKNIINRNFPSHYRKAIEKYFKKLAKQKANTSK
ncbi:MAG: hypothetical protein QM501_04750 [Gimesia sp.]